MFWSWGTAVPAIAQVTVFTAAAAWFAGHAIFTAGAHHPASRHQNWYHAGTMAVMVWMAVALPLMTPPTPVAAGMAGMAMDPHAAATTAAALSAPALGSAAWASTACLVLAAALLAAAFWQAIAAVRPLAAAPGTQSPGPAPTEHVPVVLRDGAGALMAAGMAVALLAMA
jgi:hypothetical protein